MSQSKGFISRIQSYTLNEIHLILKSLCHDEMIIFFAILNRFAVIIVSVSVANFKYNFI
jgi:hypothetical protein